MVKEKLTGQFTTRLQKVELNEVPSESGKPLPGAQLNYSDQISWDALPQKLRVKLTRTIKFEPETLFSIVVSYYVDHELSEENALSNISPENLRGEICKDLPYYLCEQQGTLSRISLIIANLTASFGGMPIVLPPALPGAEDLH